MFNTFIISIISISNILKLTHAEILGCSRDISRFCGPCRNPGLCQLQCIGREDICVENILTCKAGEQCQVDCIAGYACMQGVIDASQATSLRLTCDVHTSCDEATVNLGAGTNAIITCSGTEASCRYLNVNGQYAGDIRIDCNSYQGCQGLTVHATNAQNVNVNCNNARGGVCNGLRLFCGAGDCSITCNGFNKCNNVQVIPGNARSFTCIGTANECRSAPVNYQAPSPPPTISPLQALKQRICV